VVPKLLLIWEIGSIYTFVLLQMRVDVEEVRLEAMAWVKSPWIEEFLWIFKLKYFHQT
jgi:hypothetical protein